MSPPHQPPCRSPPFTEFSGVVLSALATENLCVYVCGGVSLSHTSFSTPYSPVPSSFCWSWGFAASQSHNTAKNLCACQLRGGAAPSRLGSVPCPVSGAVISLWVVEEEKKAGKLSQPCRQVWHLPARALRGDAICFLFWDQSKNQIPFPMSSREAHCLLRAGGSFSNSAPNFVYMGGVMEQGNKEGGGLGPGPLEPKWGFLA